MTRAVEIVRKVAPQAQASYLAAFENGDGLLRQHDVTTPERLAHFLAQILHETGGLRLEHESMNYRAERIMEIFGVGRHSAAIRPAEAQNLAHNERALAERVYGLGNPGKAAELGNTQAGDGFRFRGGGLMQTTGRANYRDTGLRCGVDFETHPEFVLSAEHALKPALVEWTQQRLNVLADNNDILAISRAINCGSAKSKKIPNGMQDRTTWFARVRPLIDSLTFQGAAPLSEPGSTGTDATAPSQVDRIPAISPLVGGAILRLNDQGPVVRAAQRALARLGYPLKGTGFFGPTTEAAVRDFQTAHRLEIDGEIGAETANAIDRAVAGQVSGGPAVPRPIAAPSPAGGISSPQPGIAPLVGSRILRMGDQDQVVRAVQLALARLGYGLKGLGYFGGATEAAVTDFQEAHALEVDGEVGPETAKAIDVAVAAVGGVVGPAAGNDQQRVSSPIDGRPLWLVEGLKWIGTAEVAGSRDSRDILRWADEEGGAISRAYTHDSIPWCALYANMVLTKVGLEGTETLWALDWANWGQRLPGPAVGAFAPMRRDGGGHIAIVVGRDQNGNLMCLGGNQDDAVNIQPFPARRPLGFRWPEGVPVPANTGLATLPLVKSDGPVSIREA